MLLRLNARITMPSYAKAVAGAVLLGMVSFFIFWDFRVLSHEYESPPVDIRSNLDFQYFDTNCVKRSAADLAKLKREVTSYENSPLFQIWVKDALAQKKPDARYPAIVGFLRSHVLLPSYSVLELGCAAGAVLRHVAEALTSMGGHGDLAGVELVPGWVEVAKRAVPNASIINADFTDIDQIKLGSEQFDLVMLNDVLEHAMVHRHACLFNVISKLSKPSTGAVYFHVPTPETQIAEGKSAGHQFYENVVPYHQVINGMAAFGFELELFQLDRDTDCGTGKENTLAAEMERSRQRGQRPTTKALGAKCSFGPNLHRHPKYAHLLFRRSEEKSLVLASQSIETPGPPELPSGPLPGPPDRLSPAPPDRLSPAPPRGVLKHAPAMDRDLIGVNIDLSYKLHVPLDWWGGLHRPTYAKAMHSLHGSDVWHDRGLQQHIQSLGLDQITYSDHGSPLNSTMLQKLLLQLRPRIFLEVGVLHGSTSIRIAKFFEQTPGFEDSFVISMDTWLLDLRFAWRGEKANGAHKAASNADTGYFQNVEIGGSSQMYFTFLYNCLKTNTSHRIIPLQTASSNGAMALIAHRLRPEFIYIDASHSNPDVFIDYENFYAILAPGGAMAVDDLHVVPAVKHAFNQFAKKYGLQPYVFDANAISANQGFIIKPLT